MIDVPQRPRLAARARLRADRHSGRHLLLYPERGLALNGTAAAIVALCDGSRTVTAIIERVAADHAVAAADVIDTVEEFLTSLTARGLLVEG
jgi:coenzyme PQQ biosynthesis protein PqqD